MDGPLHELRNRLLKAFQSRIPRLSKGPGKSRIPRAAWVFPAALMLGAWANQGSREEGRLNWLRENPPSLTTWNFLITRRGFNPIEDSVWRERAFVEMPDSGRARDAVLISEDHTVLALRTEGDWLFFSLGRPDGSGGAIVKRSLWERLGIGWEAVAEFERTSLPNFRPAAEKTSKSAEWRDARRLDY